jgi:hypothetical protein
LQLLQPATVHRETLDKAVEEEPMSSHAKRYIISDVGLAKVSVVLRDKPL